MSYEAVEPSRLGQFPGVLGNTTPAEVGTVTLRPIETSGQFTLEFIHNEYNADAHQSKGIAEGKYALGTATWDRGQWIGEIKPYLQSKSREWLTEEPKIAQNEMAAYSFGLYITADIAQGIAAREAEHVSDFTLAWKYTFEVMDSAIKRLTPQSSDRHAVSELVSILQGERHNYVVPANPGNLDSWGLRLKDIYGTLCDHSQKRDKRFEHGPAGYQLSASDGKIWVQLVLKDPHPDSSDYVKPEELAVVYMSSGFDPLAPQTAPQPQLANGTAVTWLDAKLEFGYSDEESRNFSSPDRYDKDCDDTIPAIKNAIAAGAVVYQQGEDNGYVWLKTQINNKKRYVYVRAELLRPTQ